MQFFSTGPAHHPGFNPGGFTRRQTRTWELGQYRSRLGEVLGPGQCSRLPGSAGAVAGEPATNFNHISKLEIQRFQHCTDVLHDHRALTNRISTQLNRTARIAR